VADSQLDRVREQFTRQADAYARMAQTQDPRPLEGLVAVAGTQPGERVLDVACGPGFLTLAFARRCGEAVGVDATENWLPRAREEAKRRGLANARFEAGDARQLPFADASFDVVACRAAFHHFPAPELVLAEMRRVAKPGGRLLIADMLGAEDAATGERHDAIERLCDPTHVRALPASTFERLFAEARLETLRTIPGTLAYDAEEWIEHGGPDAATAREILSRLEASIAGDTAGLAVERAAGRLRFRHRTALYVLRRPD
jgi:ubiquinone/menaquinone biosynthesis C-methylase UbiE